MKTLTTSADKGGEKPWQRAAGVNPPIQEGFITHTMYHADEVRDFQQVPKGDKVKVSEKEVELGVGLIDRLTSEDFNPEIYQDEYRIRVLAMLDEKSKGKEVTISAPALQRDGKIVDIMEALKRSMERIPAKKKPALAGAAKKKKRVISQKQTDLTSRVLLLVSPSTIGGTGKAFIPGMQHRLISPPSA